MILNTGEFSGLAGIVVALLILAGGIVSISTRSIGKDGDITLMLLFGIATLIGLTMAGTIYLDLYVWAFWGAINMITAIVSFNQNNSEPKVVDTVNKTDISNHSTERITENKETYAIGAVENLADQEAIANKRFMWVVFVVFVCIVFAVIIMSIYNIRSGY